MKIELPVQIGPDPAKPDQAHPAVADGNRRRFGFGSRIRRNAQYGGAGGKSKSMHESSLSGAPKALA